MDSITNWFVRFNDRLIAFVVHHVTLLKDPESMAGLFIATLWAVMAAAWGGWPVVLIFVAIIWTLHMMAVESGNHVVLWLTTAALLVLIVVASESNFDGLPPVLLAAAGASALGYNELIRLNYTRRRHAVVHETVFQSSAVGLAATAGLALAGVALIQALSEAGNRTWLWMPAAVGALLLIGVAISVTPTRRANQASKQRWQPGDRIPPQPLGREDLENF